MADAATSAPNVKREETEAETAPSVWLLAAAADDFAVEVDEADVALEVADFEAEAVEETVPKVPELAEEEMPST